MEEDKVREGRSFAETPNWAVATVITVLVVLGFFVHTCLKHFGKVKQKALSLSLESLMHYMLFGLCFNLINLYFNSGWTRPRENLYLLLWTRLKMVTEFNLKIFSTNMLT